MNIRIFFHLFPEEAKAIGMTHHGTMFGIPCYIKDPFVEDGVVQAIGVMPLLTFLFYPLGWAYNVFTLVTQLDFPIMNVDYKL